jgi:platelet-activating factor acetylhydrolase IB subunit alpha
MSREDDSLMLFGLLFGDLADALQVGHDNWIRALVFHPSGKYLLSASDDKTIKVWELNTGRCVKTIDAHGHFVTCMAWGRATIGGAAAPGTDAGDAAGAGTGGKQANGDAPVRRVNVLATGSVDQTVKVSAADDDQLISP